MGLEWEKVREHERKTRSAEPKDYALPEDDPGIETLQRVSKRLRPQPPMRSVQEIVDRQEREVLLRQQKIALLEALDEVSKERRKAQREAYLSGLKLTFNGTARIYSRDIPEE